MKITGQIDAGVGQEELPSRRMLPDGSCLRELAYVQVEHVLQIWVDGAPIMRITCSPDHLPELVLGRLLTEGIVQAAEEVEELRFEGAETVHLALCRACDNSGGSSIQDVSTCSVDQRSLVACGGQALPQVGPIDWTEEDIFALARAFRKDSPMHRASFGAHSCYLARGAEVLYCCEDLGRHNALDKAIGCALRDGVDLTGCAIFTSGRVPTDMVSKVLRARIPLMVSKAVPTTRALTLAETHGLTLICSAYPDAFTLFGGSSG